MAGKQGINIPFPPLISYLSLLGVIKPSESQAAQVQLATAKAAIINFIQL
jgi:hypothetical protein